ncbi:hypothetical protein Aduo_011760 [Ancylostoma duodenale]
MLKKKTVVPAQWDVLLPMVVFAYNSAPHEAVGESPFYMLHAFDPNYPSNEIPGEHLSWNHIDFDDYKYELMAGINHISECAKELNENYKENMKQKYDARNKVDPNKLPKGYDGKHRQLALSLFFVCPGAGKGGPDDPDDYNCTLRDKRFSDVVPDETDPLIRDLRVHSLFSLARMISVHENETDRDKKRFLMRCPSYTFITVSGAEKAYTFYKRYCDHMVKALILHDGSPIAMTAKDDVNLEISQLNNLANSGIRYASTHSWDDVISRGARNSTIIFLPSGFRGFSRVLKTEPEVTIVIYNELHDVPAELSAACGARTCIFVTPTSEKPYDKAEWCALGMAFTNIVRGGVKLIAISGPRGESAWSQNRKDATDMLEVVRDASAAMRSNVVTTFSSVPSRERAASSTYAPIRNFSHSFSGARGCGARRGHRGRFDSIRGSFRGGKGYHPYCC